MKKDTYIDIFNKIDTMINGINPTLTSIQTKAKPGKIIKQLVIN